MFEPLVPLDSPELKGGPYTRNQFLNGQVNVGDCGLLYGYCFQPQRFTGGPNVFGTSTKLLSVGGLDFYKRPDGAIVIDDGEKELRLDESRKIAIGGSGGIAPVIDPHKGNEQGSILLKPHHALKLAATLGQIVWTVEGTFKVQNA